MVSRTKKAASGGPAGNHIIASTSRRPKTKQSSNGGGRPTVHSPELVDAFCLLLMTGCTLREACAEPGMPGLTTVMRWLAEDRGGFRAQYARAREVQAELDVDDQVAIADEPGTAMVIEWAEVSTGKKGEKKRTPVLVALDSAEVANRRLRADARRWRAAKMNPKKYGGLGEIKTGSGDGIPLVRIKDFTGRKD